MTRGLTIVNVYSGGSGCGGGDSGGGEVVPQSSFWGWLMLPVTGEPEMTRCDLILRVCPAWVMHL